MTSDLQFKVEVPDEASSNDAQLVISQILADAIPRAEREGLEGRLLVCVELWVVVRMVWAEPAFGNEGVGLDEVVGVVVDGPLEDRNKSLRGVVSCDCPCLFEVLLLTDG